MRAAIWILAVMAAGLAGSAAANCKVEVSSVGGGRLEVSTWDAQAANAFSPFPDGYSAGAGSIWYPPVKGTDMVLSIHYSHGSLDDVGDPDLVSGEYPRVTGDAMDQYEAVVDIDSLKGAHFAMAGSESADRYGIQLISDDMAVMAALHRGLKAGQPLNVTIERREPHWVGDDFDGTYFELKAYDASKPVMTATFDTSAVKARDALLAEGKRRLLAGEGDCRD